MLLMAHHVVLNLFDLVVIEPETMPEHAVLAIVSAVLLALVCYGTRAAIRDMRSWLSRQRDTAVA